jgi:hypothetical protein
VELESGAVSLNANNKRRGSAMKKFKDIFVGLLFMAGGFLFWYAMVGNPFNDLALIRRGVTTAGIITALHEDIGDDSEGRAVFFHSASYAFQLPDRRTIKARTRDYSGRLPPDDIPRKIQVEYLPDDPSVSRIKGTGSPTVTDWLWRKLGFGGLLLLMCLSPGIAILYKYSPDRQSN